MSGSGCRLMIREWFAQSASNLVWKPWQWHGTFGERRAIEAKRNADNSTEALYANDVGKLPDENVAK